MSLAVFVVALSKAEEKKTRSFGQKHDHVTARKAETRDLR